MTVTNYLDDFLFIELTLTRCNALVSKFLNLCKDICVPVSGDKTEWAAERIVFLGILLDGGKLSFVSTIGQMWKGIEYVE